MKPILFILVTIPFLIFSNCKPETVDFPATDFKVKILIMDVDANSSDHKIPVIMQFFLNGKYVKLTDNSVVKCNGVILTDNGLGYTGRVRLLTPGGTYIFSHIRNGVHTVVDFTIPQRPVIVSPSANSLVPRSSNLSITYIPDRSAGVRASAGDGSTGKNGNLQSDNGTYTGFNVSDLNSGSGSLGIYREYENIHREYGNTYNGDSRFLSVESKYTVGAKINITWQ